MRRVLIVGLCLAAAVAGLTPARAGAPLTLTGANDTARPVRWSGVAEAAPGGRADSLLGDVSEQAGASLKDLAVRIGTARNAKAYVSVHAMQPDDLIVQVYESSGRLVLAADESGLEDETAVFRVTNNATYRVRVFSKTGVATATEYQASAWLRDVSGTNTGVGRRLRYQKPNVCGDIPKRDAKNKPIPLPPCYFKIKVPINIVFVGFDKREVEASKGDILSALPDTEDQAPKVKPVVLNESSTGGAGYVAREGGAAVRTLALLQGSSLGYLPFAYEHQFRIHVADEQYTRRVFAAAKTFTSPGEFSNPRDRAYLEAYNARAAGLRRARPVAPGSPVDFIDAVKLEDWMARNPMKGLAPGGYTYVVLDTYRPSFAGEYFNLDRYHHFRVMNADTKDPDTGEERGFDWGRVWGGRQRLIMLDTGAAPNSFEGSTQQKSVPYRTAFDGDSALLDPPVWEYTGCVDPVDCADLIPQFYQRISENILSGTFLRFTPSYASRPRGFDRYLLSSHTWTDAQSTVQAAEFNAGLVHVRARELIPGARIDIRSASKKLAAGSIEQAALEEGRLRGSGRVAASPILRLIDGKRGTYAPESGSTASIPIVNVAHAAALKWNGGDDAGMSVPLQGGVPWGVLTGVNAVEIGPGLTVQAMRGIGRAFGLLPPTEGVFYTDDLPPELSNLNPHPAKPEEQERAYYKAFDYTHATTATPMSVGFYYGRFGALDRDAITRALTIDWLDRSLDDVADAYAALDARGHLTVPDNVTKQILIGGKYIGNAVAFMAAGAAKEAVANARIAKREMEKVVWLALRAPRRR